MKEYIWLATKNPDFFMSIVLLWIMFVFFIPMVWFFIKTLRDWIVAELKLIRQDFKEHWESDEKQLEKIFKKLEFNSVRYITEFTNLKNSLTKNNLPDDDLIEVAIARVWITSEKKLDFIKKRLEKNNLRDRQDVVKRQIETELRRRSEEYIIFLNKFNSSVWLIWDWISDNFPMEEFLAEIYDVIFRELDNHTDECALIKINDIRFLMMSYQREMFEELRKQLYNNK